MKAHERERKPSDSAEVGILVEGFDNHVATDGSLLGVTGKWCACGWSVVQLDHDEEMCGPDARDVRNAGCRAGGAAYHLKS